MTNIFRLIDIESRSENSKLFFSWLISEKIGYMHENGFLHSLVVMDLFIFHVARNGFVLYAQKLGATDRCAISNRIGK